MTPARKEAIKPVPSAQRTPSPRGGEGRGEGAPAFQNILRNLRHIASRANLDAVRRRDQTVAEKKLWFQLRDRRLGGWKFRRQCPVDRYIVDFLCADAHLIVEVDGGQHAVRPEPDARRTEILESLGYLVLRYWNSDVMANTEGVVEDIATMLDSFGLEPAPPQQSEQHLP